MTNGHVIDLRKCIVGASARAVILEIEGEKVFCHNSVYNKLVKNPDIEFGLHIREAHTDSRTGKWYPETYWVCAYLPTIIAR